MTRATCKPSMSGKVRAKILEEGLASVEEKGIRVMVLNDEQRFPCKTPISQILRWPDFQSKNITG